ncbi:hypothetical protein [Nostoc sp. ChiQUE01b]|uniref:hypothetical protein n=1 Tax=Nostoc sp. ChiQUE01b TaxID=3075376 RepID=UPI002AD26E88|nr:hypothetical protein [Nostoc sp. ChiQUE01b]MDZ8260513.1 hypothetical protein [Nostoc sp. ChiQUE01b]
MTKIFLSWSGNAGRDIAKALRDLLPVPLPMSDPFMSDIDITKGRRLVLVNTKEKDIGSFNANRGRVRAQMVVAIKNSGLFT